MEIQDALTLNRGSDLTMSIFWASAPDSQVGMNLTGYAVDAIEVHPLLAGHLNLSITNAAGGIITGSIEWQDDMPYGQIMHFRIRISIGTTTVTTPAIGVNVI